MSKHTPGPWYIDSEIDTQVYIVDNKKNTAIVRVMSGRPDGEANASLIAASPDLYAVLKELQESAAYWSEYDVPLGIVDRINQAIAKAEGTK